MYQMRTTLFQEDPDIEADAIPVCEYREPECGTHRSDSDGFFATREVLNAFTHKTKFYSQILSVRLVSPAVLWQDECPNNQSARFSLPDKFVLLWKDNNSRLGMYRAELIQYAVGRDWKELRRSM
jgi:hypothetical protein